MPAQETISFADLYERVTDHAAGTVAHRFYVRSPERVIAVVTQGGPQAGTLYVHVDHVGSVDVLTDAGGAVSERRSYDPFGSGGTRCGARPCRRRSRRRRRSTSPGTRATRTWGS
jgi:hypothetical protein